MRDIVSVDQDESALLERYRAASNEIKEAVRRVLVPPLFKLPAAAANE